MAGHIAGLGYSQRMDANGDPLSACKLYIYETGTSTPVTVYSDYALSIEHPWPLVADSAGIIPMFWVDDGTYRVRLTDAAGNEIFDDDGIVALGPSTSSGGGGSSVSVDSNAIAATGDFNWQPVSGTRTGWVRANARTIGASASGATERANADCENLFLFLWNTFSNTLCPVTGGRGANAAADWAANKVIATLDMRSKGGFGLDDMGNTSAGITGGSTSAAASIGASTYTVAQANLPNVNFTLSITDTRKYEFTQRDTGDSQDVASGGASAADDTNMTSTLSLASPSSGSISGTAASGGSGTDLDILSPARVGTWYIRL